jgi:hypothetical protein
MYRHAEPVRTIHLRARFEDLAQVVVGLRSVFSDEREVRGDEVPLFIGNVTGVWFSSSHDQMLPCTG